MKTAPRIIIPALGALLMGCATSPILEQATIIQRQVNASISFQSDLEQYGERDRWVVDPASGRGDCEDYALTKQRRLAQVGIPSTVGVCITYTGVAHAVAVVPDGQERWVLDNIHPEPITWAGYQGGCPTWKPVSKPVHEGR